MEMKKIQIKAHAGKYRVVFYDKSGFSILDETKSPSQAKRSLNKFKKDLSEGRLLRPTRRVAGWRDYYPRKKLKKVM